MQLGNVDIITSASRCSTCYNARSCCHSAQAFHRFYAGSYRVRGLCVSRIRTYTCVCARSVCVSHTHIHMCVCVCGVRVGRLLSGSRCLSRIRKNTHVCVCVSRIRTYTACDIARMLPMYVSVRACVHGCVCMCLRAYVCVCVLMLAYVRVRVSRVTHATVLMCIYIHADRYICVFTTYEQDTRFQRYVFVCVSVGYPHTPPR